MAANRRDDNRVPTIAGVDSILFNTPTEPAVDPTTHELLTKSSQSGTWNITNISGTISLPTGASTSAKQDTQTILLQGIAGFTPSVYDYILLTYTGDDLTGVVYKTGGSGGTTVATLTLAYTSGILQSVTKT